MKLLMLCREPRLYSCRRLKQAAEANCKTAQMNLSFAQNARTDKREALIQRFNQEVAKYCK